MKKLNTTNKNYTTNEKCFQLQIPMNLNIIIPDDDSVRLLSQFVEEMDLTCLYETYSMFKENQVTPRQMLKILLYAYLDGKYSSREIEKACHRDVNLITCIFLKANMYLIMSPLQDFAVSILHPVQKIFSPNVQNFCLSSAKFPEKIFSLTEPR